jgi:hypothetical protein
LPEILQEAVVYYATDMDYCAKYGVSSDVSSRFYDINALADKAQESEGTDQSNLFKPFRNTFWYYMMLNHDNL